LKNSPSKADKGDITKISLGIENV